MSSQTARTQPAQPNVTESHKSDNFNLIADILYGLYLILFVIGIIQNFSGNQKEEITSTIWAMVLLAIPFVAQLAIFFKLRKKPHNAFCRYFLVTMALCIITYSSSWILYATPLRDSWILSGVALVSIIGLTVLSMRMTLATIKADPNTTGKADPNKAGVENIRWRQMWNLQNLSSGVAQEKPMALIFFFTVFLSISYLFAFVLAFHDKSLVSQGQRALYMKNLDSSASQGATSQSSKTHNSNSVENGFQLTDQSLNCLKAEGIPDALVQKLQYLKGASFDKEDAFKRLV